MSGKEKVKVRKPKESDEPSKHSSSVPSDDGKSSKHKHGAAPTAAAHRLMPIHLNDVRGTALALNVGEAMTYAELVRAGGVRAVRLSACLAVARLCGARRGAARRSARRA